MTRRHALIFACVVAVACVLGIVDARAAYALTLMPLGVSR